MIPIQDYHIHPDYSTDAEGTVDEFCAAAIQAGLTEIAFTTHLDTNPVADYCHVLVKGDKVSSQKDYWLEDYESTVRTAGERFKQDGLTVRLGVELDCYPGVMANLPERFHSTDFDLILGSAHILGEDDLGTPSGMNNLLNAYGPEEMVRRYYLMIMESIELDSFDVLSHLDIYRRHGEAVCGDCVHGLWEPHVSELVSTMKRFNVGFEVNTSTWGQGLSDPMPTEQFVTALHDHGIETVTLGSDAHRLPHVGKGIARALELVKRCGFTHLSFFEKRCIRKHPIN